LIPATPSTIVATVSLSARALAAVVALAPALVTERAAAQMPEGPEPAWEQTVATRRAGFTAGLGLGGALGMAAGYPNDSKKIGRAAHYTETGIGGGFAGTVWLGAALSDWFVFGLGFATGRLDPSEGPVADAGIFFKIDAFPLFPLGGAYRDLGLTLETGTGGATVKDPDAPDTDLIDGGAPARIGLGAFYEGIRFWKISTGPFAGMNYMWSETIRRGEAVLGWRAVVYARP
jgi:hypothetical protein